MVNLKNEGDVLRRRFMARMRDMPSGCIEWTGASRDSGWGRYGCIFSNGRQQLAHRVSWELFRGKIPDGLTIDHLCRNTLCVNVEHLEPVTSVENVMRGMGPFAKKARQTHCKRGHPFDERNTHVAKNGTRHCKACNNYARTKTE